MATGRKVEIELKYEVAVSGGADRYLVAPNLGPFKPVGHVRSTRVEDRYVDSADWALSRAGFAARLRRTTRGTQIGLKRQAAAEGRLQRREELEGPADSESAPMDWPTSSARSVILELCGDAPLVELLTIRQLRRVRRLESGDTRAELSVDEVEVRGDERTLDRFEELEVELTAGPEEPLHSLGDVLDRDDGLSHASRSKLDRAVGAIRAALPTMPDDLQKRWLEVPPELLVRRPPHPKAERAGRAGGGRPPAEAQATSAEPTPEADPIALPTSPRLAQAPVGTRLNGPRALGVLPDDSLPEAARKVLRYHFARMRTKEAGSRSGSDVEDLHDMRVASRRMRAAWRVFEEAFKPGRTKKLRRRLETLSDRLGAVRDLDVLIEDLEAYRAGLDAGDRPGLDPLLALWSRQRGPARDVLIRELDSARYAAFVEEMEAFLEAGANEAATVATPTLPHRVRDRVPSQIWSAYEAVRAYELVLPWADVETLHELRIAAKWLRYTLEFFGETLGPDSTRLLDRVMALQDFLGCLHDADVAAKLARDVLVARAGELTRLETDTIGAYLHSREREVARRRRALGPVWRAVTGAPFRRALGRATAAL
jgi:CHAD domain-containing protein